MQTRVGDLKLIHHLGRPVLYARVEEITADVKPGWWQVRLLLLQVPAREVTWILRDEYIDGGEFTMNGEAMRLEAVPPPAPQTSGLPEPEPPSRDQAPRGAKVVDLSARRRPKH